MLNAFLQFIKQLLCGVLFCCAMFVFMQYVCYTEITEAVKFGDISHVNKIIDTFKLFDIKPYVLCESAKYGQIGILKHLLELGTDLHECAYRIALENRQQAFVDFVTGLYKK